MEPEIVVDRACRVGENPMWHPDEQCVYWVDIPAARIFRYDPSSAQTAEWEVDKPVGGFTIQADGALLLFMADGTVRTWYHGQTNTIIDELPEERGNRFNDVIADPEGRVFCGTMSTSERAGRLYRLDTDGSIHCLLEGVGTSNGMGFTPECDRMYHTDTRERTIYLFDYERRTGAISNKRAFVQVEEGLGGRPDGLTVDSEGCVWSARWDGYRLVRYTPEGKLIDTVNFPVCKVSSLTFGGESCTHIYVTTAGGGNRPSEGTYAGALFHLNAPVQGVTEFRSKVRMQP